MLVHVKKIISKAERGGYAVGAFNVNNLEIIAAVLNAAEKLKSPVIIQTTEGAIEYAGLEELVALVKAAAADLKVPVALHLDHGHDFELIKKCIEYGYSSVMIDASDKPFKKNIALVKKVVNYAHKRQVWVQAELGRLEGSEDWIKVGQKDVYLTEPEEAKDFVKQTGVDTFAPAIGNYHGVGKIINKKVLKLDLKRLEKIDKLVKVPLVLHGASGFPDNQIKGAVKAGVRVINIDSELRISFTKAERKFLKLNKDVYDPRKILAPAIKAMQKTVEKKILVLGSNDKA
ncbi:class II fructose-1,6-bisphosphate aldolase [Candidatus Falkowbacteria bacterium]|jgi:fructose-bisphosphate aldolase, class II|nr:class II fructose-1,6-bisphosphate aldolase [Candidatus Falkowbacteria bacterium]MBT5503855.1 class II fructose-1,6-bisphosphate aldolase [Candidatus Falkowbacteria bacterium]MBT6574398.1 class II fructose-1,6-bisphosphate aldolase [Candidatus Falkowbacteria bacterium]MBT7348915.1 class II fructose-1,6-bisphosphate aldolase [Candidatus Falkowbacteria bacterium]MBT7501271.1 class II fructose-1,6-bisphosphate aldolase [Candidatus Falkowbacteria bacterium]